MTPLQPERPGRVVWVHPCDCERCRDNPDGPVMLPPDAADGAHDSLPEPTRKATGDELRDAEVRATRPWADDTGSFTAFVEAVTG